MNLLSPLMTKAQLAAELNIGEQTLGNFRKRYSTMPAPIKLGAKLYWHRDQIETWLAKFSPSKKHKRD